MPFESKATQIMEIINEGFFLIALYHMIVFSDIYDDEDFKFIMGWSINLLVLL